MSNIDTLRNSPWPSNDLEDVESCPWCQAEDSQTLYDNLIDIVFKTAPGTWKFEQCNKCKSGFLNPRPTKETLYRAYENYYTHNEHSTPNSSRIRKVIKKLRLALINGYRNKVYNTTFTPSLGVGYFITSLRSQTMNVIKDDLRYLPRIPLGAKPKILDIGCGNLGYLRMVSQGGWQAFGCDPDQKVVNNLFKGDNIELRVGGSEAFLDDAGTFDIVTLSHVIEHVHNPIEDLERIFQLLKPGGFFYLDTPNIASFGHSFWKKYWLGLDAPRHLSLPTKNMLTETLKNLGFTNIEFVNRPRVYQSFSVKSARLENGKNYRDPSADHQLRLPKTKPNGDEISEFLTVICVKPKWK